jgi:hypothetical protein
MFMLATLKELQLATLNVLPFFTLCSVRVSALVTVRKNLKIGDLFDFQRGHIASARLAGASVTKTPERQFPRLCRHTRIMGRQHQRRGTVGENQH